MSKWRPAPECIYVIPDIHGYYSALEQILNRILPLRPDDQLIFLGDYVDRGPHSHKVLDKLVELVAEYGDQVTVLMGNHEWLFLTGIGVIDVPSPTPGVPHPLDVWMAHGGPQTIKGYCEAAGIEDYLSLPLHRMIDIVPQSHIDLLTKNTYKCYEHGDYIFCHAGCDPTYPLEEQDDDIFLWDRSLYRTALRCIHKQVEMPWEKTVVTGHNYNGPIISPKFMMLDCSHHKKLLTVELNSMEGFYAYPGRTRMLRADLEETTKLPTYVRRNI